MADTNTTVIGLGTRIKGEMTFEGTARVDGEFEGKISSSGELLVAESGTCRATIEVGMAIVDGVVEGNVTARDKVLLNPSAHMNGDLAAKSLTVAEGATLDGHVHVSDGAVAAEPAKPRIVISTGRPAATGAAANTGSDLENSLAGLESKIAGLGRPKLATGTD